jgi:hypothetical protein
MDDLMLMEYFRNKGMGNMSEHEFSRKFYDMMNKYKMERTHGDFYPTYSDTYKNMYMKRHMYPEEFTPEFDYRKDRFFDSTPELHYKHSDNYSDHFNEPYAKFIVSEMHHIESGRKHTGEKFDYTKAKEVYEKYKSMIPMDTTICDIYVAINAQYHDYAQLFKTWFGSNIDNKIIESAIVFWFKDTDYTKGSKVWNYFKD